MKVADAITFVFREPDFDHQNGHRPHNVIEFGRENLGDPSGGAPPISSFE